MGSITEVARIASADCSFFFFVTLILRLLELLCSTFFVQFYVGLEEDKRMDSKSGAFPGKAG